MNCTISLFGSGSGGFEISFETVSGAVCNFSSVFIGISHGLKDEVDFSSMNEGV
jgi:hypothetical protein